jgi:phytanoyl-CoA hydroxylase
MITIGDIKPSEGGLMYFEQSSGIGQETEAEFTRRNANLPPEERLNAFNVNMANGGKFITGDAFRYQRERAPGRRWLIANYEAGDVVFHNPWLVHCASMNMSEAGSIRLSADVRYVEEGSDFDHRWNQAYWHPEDGL